MRTIDVIPNPFCSVDKDGVPQGVVPVPGSRSSYIGAQLDLVASTRTGKTRFYFPPPNTKKGQKGVAGLRVVTVELTTEISTAVQEGSLIAADKDSAHVCSIRKDYLEPAQALRDEEEKALAYVQSLKGKNAELQPFPTEPASDDAAAVEGNGQVRITPTLTLETEA